MDNNRKPYENQFLSIIAEAMKRHAAKNEGKVSLVGSDVEREFKTTDPVMLECEASLIGQAQ